MAGIVIGAVIGLGSLALALWYFLYKRRRNNRRYSVDLDASPTLIRLHSNTSDQVVVEPYMEGPTNQSSIYLATKERQGSKENALLTGSNLTVNRSPSSTELRSPLGASSEGEPPRSRSVFLCFL